MQNKKQFSQVLLGIALVLSLLRSDNSDSFRHRNSGHLFRLPELQDILLGQTAVMTQTEFHNLFNSEDGDYVHPKGLQRDSRFLNSILDSPTFDPENWMDMSPYREVTTLLLDRLEPSNGRPVLLNHPNNGNNHGEDENGNQGNENESGAMSIPPSPSDELTQEDMDMIERLWRQDIDMGICRDDSLSTKEGYEIEKPLKKPEENIWDNFSIDNETGEFMQPVIDPASQVNTQQTTIPQQPQVTFPGQTHENGMTLEECLQILEEDLTNPLQTARQETAPAMQRQINSPQEMEQRWQDFASLSDINLNLPAINPEVSPEYHQQAVMPENFTTMGSPMNFGMALPNTTENLNMLHYPSAHTTNLPANMHSTEDIFTSTPSLSDLSVNTTSLPSASLHIPEMNFTNLLMSDTTNRSITESYNSQQNDTSTSSLSPRNSTSPLLLDLLNSSSLDEVNTMDIDGQIRDVMDVLDDRDSAISLGSVSQYTEQSDSSSLYSGSEDGSSEGAVGGYDGSLDQDIKGASGYSRGNAQYGGDRQGGGQANHNGQQSSMNSITHNHTYSNMSSRNGSMNGNSSKKSHHQKHNHDMGSRFSRDEKRAKQLKIPIPIEKIIDLPVDQFNELLKKFELTDPQLALVRDIRRRGKNKVAAQNCRKRKIDAIYTIEEEIDLLKAEKDELLKERGNIDKESLDMRDRYTQLYREVFQSLCDDHGDPVNPNNFSLQQMPDGSVYLVPRNSTLPEDDKE